MLDVNNIIDLITSLLKIMDYAQYLIESNLYSAYLIYYYYDDIYNNLI